MNGYSTTAACSRRDGIGFISRYNIYIYALVYKKTCPLQGRLFVASGVVSAHSFQFSLRRQTARKST